MKVFRWSGLIGFVIVGALLVILGVFFIDNWLRAGLEAGGTRVNGAEVNVGDVDLALSPLGFEIREVRITNARQPSRNLFELDEARLEINLPRLFLGKVSIDDLTVDGVRADTERPSPGRVLDRESDDGPGATERARERVEERMAAVRNELPDPDTTARDALTRTREQAATAEQAMNQALDRVQAAVDNLPGQASLDDYDRRIANLRGREVQSLEQLRRLQADFEALQREVAEDQIAIAGARQSADNAVGTARQSLDAVLEAPERDWAALREAYPLNQASAVRAGRLLLGDAIFDRVEQLQTYYRQASPWLRRLAPRGGEDEPQGPQRLDGRFVRFAHPDPSPDFLMRRALVGFEADGWPWSLTLRDLTGQQSLTNQPVTLRLARGEAGSEGLLIQGSLDRRGAENIDRFEVTGRDLGWEPRQVDFMDATLDWTPGQVDLGGEVEVRGDALTGRLALTFNQTGFQSDGSGQVATLLGRALAGIEDFEVAVRISGQVDAPQIQVTSDLDDRLNDQLAALLRAEYDRWLAEARTRLDAEVARLREPLEAELNRIRARRDVVERRAEAFQQQVVARLGALEQEIQSRRQQLNQRLEQERNRAGEALEGLDLPSF